MKISARVACSPTEARRLLGQPDLLPLYQITAEAVERSVMERVAGLATKATSSTADTADRMDRKAVQRPATIRPAG